MDEDVEDNELFNLLEGLCQDDQEKLCNGELSLDCEVTFVSLKVFDSIFKIIDRIGCTRKVAIPNILQCINKDLPYSSDISNMVKKHKLSTKIDNSKDDEKAKILKQCIIKVNEKKEPNAFELFFNTSKLKEGVIQENNSFAILSNEVFLELGKLVTKDKKLTWGLVSSWLQKKFKLVQAPKQQNVTRDFGRLKTKGSELSKHNKEKHISFLKAPYIVPGQKSSHESSTYQSSHSSNDCKPETVPPRPSFIATDQSDSRSGILMSELFQAYHQMAEMDLVISELSTNLHKLGSASKMLETEKEKQMNDLKNQLRILTTKYHKLEGQLEASQQKVGHYKPRNVNKRIGRKDQTINDQQVIIDVLEENVIDLDMKTLELEEKLKNMTAKYESERVKVHYWKKS